MNQQNYGYDLLIDKSVDKNTYINDQNRIRKLILLFKILNISKFVLAFLLGMVIANLI